MESSQESLFEQAMARYQAGADAAEILPDFLKITEAAPRQSAGWTCLAWLQLLCEQPEEALRSARFAVKLNGQDPQARINLSLALLETQSKGVRDHIRWCSRSPRLLQTWRRPPTSIADGLKRRRAEALEKVKSWLTL